MQRFILTAANGWVLVSSSSVCRLQVVRGWHPGALRVFVGSSTPDDTSPYFEVSQGEFWIKDSTANDVYVYAPFAIEVNSPAHVIVSADVDSSGGTGGGGGGTGDASAANQVITNSKLTDVSNKLTTVTDKLTELNLDNATEVTLAAILTKLGGIITTVNPTSAYTCSLTRSSTTGTTPVGSEKVTITNVGIADGIVQGVVLKIGESLTYEAPARGIITTIPFDATGTEFLITAVIFSAVIIDGGGNDNITNSAN